MKLFGARQLADSIRTIRENTILIAEDIPEEQYAYRPTSDSRSVAETLIHIALFSRFDRLLWEEHVRRLVEFDFGKFFGDGELEERKSHSKQEIIDWLRSGGESWAQWVEDMSEEILAEEVGQLGGRPAKTRFEMIWGTMGHEIHHRAQLTVVERLLGVVPHLTRRMRSPRILATPAAVLAK